MRCKQLLLPIIGVTSLAAVLLAGGCVGTGQSPPTRFYLLSSIDPADSASDTPTGMEDAGIGLGPIRFPAYLNRQHIVTRTGPNELQLAEFDRWAEPLEDNFVNVLKENLSILLHTPAILESPWPKEASPEFQVVAGVSRFDAEPGRQAVLMVRWGVIRVKDERLLLVKKSTHSAALNSGGYREIAQVQSRLVAAFSREVAAALQDLYRREHGQ